MAAQGLLAGDNGFRIQAGMEIDFGHACSRVDYAAERAWADARIPDRHLEGGDR
jgi:hypothetical protein